MHIGILTISFSLPGCGSLKEKRQRMGGIHERFGRSPSVAVCESGERDKHDASEWSFVVVAPSRREIESQCSQIEDKILRTVDGRVMNVIREFI
ncbi:DUF503 domain-containing protein [Aliidiomarina quisquiliarum]|uniref:DUF503 domain-containing protein n=1 Tax=Aliidiomarina quisquiliarum TaxID=2938947 RepID=UPI00208E8AE1|nr:DUF503 domain-containing protein [Aliidiomarina quisquiliarum]MCO4321744.1 DUF503 domain-containing protein [Aliidiomarina quisquiliarum]